MNNCRKGSCLKCDYLKVDVFGIDAWCTYKNMKVIQGAFIKDEM